MQIIKLGAYDAIQVAGGAFATVHELNSGGEARNYYNVAMISGNSMGVAVRQGGNTVLSFDIHNNINENVTTKRLVKSPDAPIRSYRLMPSLLFTLSRRYNKSPGAWPLSKTVCKKYKRAILD